MSTYKNVDDCTDTILDFIRGGWKDKNGRVHNMEAGGSYDATIGSMKGEAGDLSLKTITEIYVLQTHLINEGKPSSAVGGYQFISKTLIGLATALRIAPDAKFTHQLQDRLAVKLLTGRGYSDWWLGHINNVAFAHNLSLEWASFPDPLNGGLSHYQGVGPNQAGCSLGDVTAMLNKAFGLRPKP